MLKGAWILPAVMLVALVLATLVPAVVYAAESRPFGSSMNTYFKDLPGVVPEQERVKPDDYSCTSDIGHAPRARGHRGVVFWDDVPVRLYHCKAANGATYTGTQMPNTQWVPGLNPHHLPK
jgi:hypothetical protein